VDNRRVLVQEWVAEAVTMWAFAVLVTAVGAGTAVADSVYRVTAGALLVLVVLTAVTRCPHPGRLVQDLSRAAHRLRGAAGGHERRLNRVGRPSRPAAGSHRGVSSTTGIRRVVRAW
jgi:hypothetical protein